MVIQTERIEMKKLASLLVLFGAMVMADEVAKDPNGLWVPLNVDANGNLSTVQAAGTAIIGKVGIDQTTPGSTNGVQVNAALPAGTNLLGKFGIDQVTPNANEIVLKSSSAVVGKVSIDQTTDGTTNKVQSHANVAGAAVSATNPMPVYGLGAAVYTTTTRPNDTTAYTALDVVGESPVAANLSFANVARRAGAGVVITGASLRVDVNAVPSGMSSFRLHLFNAAPTAILDNAAFNLIQADRTKYLGYIEIPTPVDMGDTLWGQVDNANLKRDLAGGSTTLYGVLQTVGAFTPSAQCVKGITIYVMEL